MTEPRVPIVLRVFGFPAPQGSKSYKGHRKGKPVLVESSAAVRPWRASVELAAALERARLGIAPIEGPVAMRMVFTMRKPKWAPKRRRTYPATYPDLSKLCRSTEDALVTSGLLKDDGQIVDYARLAKVYPGEDPEALDAPGVLMVIEAIGEDRGSA